MKLLVLLRNWITSNFFIGTDIVQVERIQLLLDKQKDQFINRIFTINESSYCLSKANPAIHFAGRFAAKESIKKALYSANQIQSLEFNKIEILSMDNGAPYIKAIEGISFKELKISISHESDYAIAMAMVLLWIIFYQKIKPMN